MTAISGLHSVRYSTASQIQKFYVFRVVQKKKENEMKNSSSEHNNTTLQQI